MKITDVKCAPLGANPVVRVTTDEGISGIGTMEGRRYFDQQLSYYRELILGEDPRNVERVMLNIRRLGAFKPWGSIVSGIEMALWDIAGKAAGLPIHRLLGGKIRDKVRIYNGGLRWPMKDSSPEAYADSTARMMAADEGFPIIKQGVVFHGDMAKDVPNFHYGEEIGHAHYANRGPLTERGLKHVVSCVEAMKSVTGDEVGLALDCGPGMLVSDAIRLAKVLEPYNLMWLEDMVTGDYTPWVLADLYREVTRSTSTPIHTGEQIFGRQNFKELFEKQAVSVIGPDPCDVGGLAELKWVAEYADLHGITMAPHGTGVGLIGLAGLVQVAAVMPQNYVAFEYPLGRPDWWYGIVEGLPDPIVNDGFIEVWDTPGLGIEINPEAAAEHLREEDKGFFD